MRCLLAIIPCLLLTACAMPGEPQAKIQTVTVDRPTPVSCVPSDSPPAPSYLDTDAAMKAATDMAERDALLKSERPKHQAREAYLEQLRTDCMKAGSISPK